MKVIGLTGGIGTGKSTVARYLSDLGAAVIELDKVGHEVIRPGRRAFKQVVSEFGKGILNTEGEIDRTRMGDIVFKNPQALARLNRIVHPFIDKTVRDSVEKYRRQGKRAVVLEAAAILEAGKEGQTDEIWVTTAPEATVLERLSKRSGYSEEESRARLRSQLAGEERIRYADVVIDTDCTLNELKARVEEEWDKLVKRDG